MTETANLDLVTTEVFNQLGMVTTAVFADMNADERPDLIVGGEWMPITVFYNLTSGWISLRTILLPRGCGDRLLLWI
jgi:hypothetical protein